MGRNVTILASCYVCEGPVDITKIKRDLSDEECFVCSNCIEKQFLLHAPMDSVTRH